MSKSAALAVAVLAAVIIGIVLGAQMIESPETMIPLTIEFLLLLGVTLLLLRREPDRSARGWLMKLIMVALLLRLAAVFVVYYVAPSPYFFALDMINYEREGELLSLHWQGLAPAPILQSSRQIAYPYINAFFHYLLGASTMGTAVLNIFAGAWTAVLTFMLGREMLNERVGKVAAVLVAVYPSLVLWSVLNIRDALTTLIVAFIVLVAVRSPKRRVRSLIVLAGALVVLSTFRDYMGVLLLAGIGMGTVAAVRRGRVGTTMVVGTALTLVLVLMAVRFGMFSVEVIEDPLASAAQLRTGLQQGAGSVFGAGADTGTVGGALRFLPLGLAFFLFAPFPWAVTSSLQLVTLPEVFLWYALMPFTVMGFRAVMGSKSRQSLVVISVLMVILVTYALVEGNFGTAYRHRAQVMPLFFLFTAAGAVQYRLRREARRTARMRVPPRGRAGVSGRPAP
ncbi:MAG: ArnT family glycosyltransferase [Longimicrobiales bacterium]